MEARELRLDNLVYFNGDHNEVGVVTGIVEAGIGYPSMIYLNHRIDIQASTGNIKPIPLTEDWLLKFGFEKHTNTFVHPNFDYQLYPRTDGTFLIYHEQLSEFYGTVIMYVHQLQNLYFYFRESELSVKQTTEVN